MTDGLGLGDAYGATLNRIKREGKERARLAMAVLMWISHAERPMNTDELCHALAVEIGSPNLNTDNAPSIDTLLACCQGLVVVEKEASAVRLIHFTLQEYLRAHPGLFGPAHATIAETCLTYLNSQQVKAFSTSPPPDLRDTPFLEYSSVYWGVHARRDLSDCAKQLALKLFDDYNTHISTNILLKAQDIWGLDADKFSGFSGLHCASFFGIVEIVIPLAEMEGCDINQVDFTGGTALHWAARNGQEGVVKKLLGWDISPDKPDNNGEIPLHPAALNGHEEVVKMLLEQDCVVPDKPDNSGKTPFLLAAGERHEGVVEMLLKRGVNPDKPDHGNRTALWWAAHQGNEVFVEFLLELGAEHDRPDDLNRTPLFIAACYGQEGMVKLLLERGAKPDTPTINGRTPLYCAACNGEEGVVKLLLEQDGVNPNKLDKDGKAPLHRAAEEGRSGVVKILLGRNDINPNQLDNHGKVPLDYATDGGHLGVVTLLQPPESAAPSLS